jgi:hypothetical protein
MGCVLEELAAVNWVGETLNSEKAAARSSAVEDLEVVLSRMAAATRTARVLE